MCVDLSRLVTDPNQGLELNGCSMSMSGIFVVVSDCSRYLLRTWSWITWSFSLELKEICRTIDGFRFGMGGTWSWSSGLGVASFTTTDGNRESAYGLGLGILEDDFLRISLNQFCQFKHTFQNFPFYPKTQLAFIKVILIFVFEPNLTENIF